MPAPGMSRLGERAKEIDARQTVLDVPEMQRT
jgi:hypothetical protein